jgi:hypothetical protein
VLSTSAEPVNVKDEPRVMNRQSERNIVMRAGSAYRLWQCESLIPQELGVMNTTTWRLSRSVTYHPNTSSHSTSTSQFPKLQKHFRPLLRPCVRTQCWGTRHVHAYDTVYISTPLITVSPLRARLLNTAVSAQHVLLSFRTSSHMKMCQFWGFRRAVAHDSVLMVYDASSRGNRIPTFRRNLNSEDDSITFCRNVGIRLPPNAPSYTTRTETLKKKTVYLLFLNDMKRTGAGGGDSPTHS